MNSEEEIARAAESLVSTLKRLHDELLGFDALLQERGRSIYDVMALEDWLDIIGVLSHLGERSGAISKLCLERFPKRLNLAGFPCGHESDSRFVLERRPVWDGEAVFGGSAGTRSEGGAGWRHDSGNGGTTRCEYQLCGTLS